MTNIALIISNTHVTIGNLTVNGTITLWLRNSARLHLDNGIGQGGIKRVKKARRKEN
jgi:hypothetical protein